MEVAVLLFTHIIAGGAGFALGKLRGYLDAQPPRDKQGRFKKKD